jgi:hypothetical protein
MKQVMVRYKVKADRAAENERYITRAYEQLKREKPSGLRYATFKLEDGVISFILRLLKSRTEAILWANCQHSRHLPLR